MAGIETIMLVDDCIAEEGLDKRRSALAKPAISGRHRSHSQWVTTQRYTAIPSNHKPRLLRDQLDTVIIFPLKELHSI